MSSKKGLELHQEKTHTEEEIQQAKQEAQEEADTDNEEPDQEQATSEQATPEQTDQTPQNTRRQTGNNPAETGTILDKSSEEVVANLEQAELSMGELLEKEITNRNREDVKRAIENRMTGADTKPETQKPDDPVQPETQEPDDSAEPENGSGGVGVLDPDAIEMENEHEPLDTAT